MNKEDKLVEKTGTKKEKKCRIYQSSLKFQITTVFVAVVAFTIIASVLINTFFLEKVYVKYKERAILSVYDAMYSEAYSGDISSDRFDLELQKYSDNHNVSIVIISTLFEPIKIYATEPQDQLIREITNNLRGGSIMAERIIYEEDDYILIQKRDARMQTDYLEMWGVLPNGAFFLMRTALESIRLYAVIANRFLLIVGLAAIILSALVIFFITKRLSRPILTLAEISKKMTELDFDARYEGKDKNEIGILGHSMNEMSDHLRNTIMELKDANAELQKDIDLKNRIDEMRKEFISNVSHELKTPIAIIEAYAEGLKENVGSPEDMDYYCDVIMDEAAKMNVMVRQLLTLNQLESGQDIITPEPFDLVALIKNYIQSAEILTAGQDIKVSLDLPEKCIVVADEFKIEEVLMNYFSNACHYCESDTEKRIDVSLKKSENEVCVSVFNTGKHIPEESINRLYEKFYKVDKARTREYGGSGVGLSIVKAIMEAHGGTYGVKNVDEGVEFFFTLKSDY